MAQTQLSEKLGSNSSPFAADLRYYPKSSGFDISRLNYGTIDNGVLTPVDCFPCLPGDKFDIKCRYILDTLPLAVAPMTNYKVYVDFYYADYHSLWKGAETFITRGRNKDLNYVIPHVSYNGDYHDDYTITKNHLYSICSPMNISNQLGIPSTTYQGSSSTNFLPFTDKSGEVGTDWFLTGNHSVDVVNALPPFMYQKIVRHNYLPSNLLQDNKIYFPDDISSEEWRIDVNGENLSADGHFVPCGAVLPSEGEYISNFIPSADKNNHMDNCVNIWQNRYAQYGNGRFTSAKPWIVRGIEETTEIDVSGITGKIFNTNDNFLHSYTYLLGKNGNEMYAGAAPFTGSYTSSFGPDGGIFSNYSISTSDKSGSVQGSPDLAGGSVFVGVSPNQIAQSLGLRVNGTGRLSLTANKLRSLMAISIKDEIDAQTNGNYNPSIQAHWGINPRHDEFDPKYIGGTVGYINFSQILQTSATSGNQVLGSEAGRGSLSLTGDIGRFTCPDYGFIMAIMRIVPDVSYSQGIQKFWTELQSKEVFWPEFSELGFEPILNKEIYISGVESTDNDLFGYTTRASHYKARDNVCTGLLSIPYDEETPLDRYFSAFAQGRSFKSTPKLSNQFLTCSPNNLRRDYLAFPNMPAYRFQFASDIRAIRPLPYLSVPSRMGM